MSDFLTHHPRKARKPHRCDVCSGAIPVGAVHVRAAGCYEGSMWASRTHPGCEWLRAAANYVLNDSPYDGWDGPCELMADADPADLAKVLAWDGINSHRWPHCFDLAALPEEEQARVRGLADAAVTP